MKRRSLALVLAAALVISLAGCSQETEATEGTAAGTQAEQTEATQEATEAAGGYTAGTYTGTATGMNGEVTVEVVFDDTSITDITVTNQSETYGIGQGLDTTPVEALPEQMLAGQTVNVDSITGATITSAAIKAAVTDCVEQAGGDA